MRFISKLCIIVLLVFFPGRGFARDPQLLLLEVGLGKFGSATELIHTPLSGAPQSDQNWVYETQPDGTSNPLFPRFLPNPGMVVNVPFPADLTDSGNILGNIQIIEENTFWCQIPQGDLNSVLTDSFFVPDCPKWHNSGIKVGASESFRITFNKRVDIEKRIVLCRIGNGTALQVFPGKDLNSDRTGFLFIAVKKSNSQNDSGCAVCAHKKPGDEVGDKDEKGYRVSVFFKNR